MQVFETLFATILQRKATADANSYTSYLFREGLDKILKKVGEEAAETLIAAKNADPAQLAGEICDLLYHVAVLMAERGLTPDDLQAELEARAQKQGNLKTFHATDHNT